MSILHSIAALSQRKLDSSATCFEKVLTWLAAALWAKASSVGPGNISKLDTQDFSCYQTILGRSLLNTGRWLHKIEVCHEDLHDCDRKSQKVAGTESQKVAGTDSTEIGIFVAYTFVSPSAQK